MAVRIKWDQYETALLIDTFWRIEEQPALRQELIKKLSDDLRRKAVSQGIVIDDVFRNVNGITMQLSSIAHSFFPERPYLTSSTIFDSMVKLYKEDRPAFDQVLREANHMISCLDNDICTRIDRKPGFEQWLANKGKKPSEISGIVSTLEDASTFAKKRKIVQYSFWEETETEFSVSSAKLMTWSYFRLMHRALVAKLKWIIPLYLEFLNEEEKRIENESEEVNHTEQKNDSQNADEGEYEPAIDVNEGSPAQIIEEEKTESSHEVPFDKTDIIYIFDNYMLVKNGAKPYSQAIEEVSVVLRKRATVLEQEVDDAFRSKEVITRSFADIERCLINNGTELAGVHPLVLQLVDQYKNDRKRYLAQSTAVWEQLKKLGIFDPIDNKVENATKTSNTEESVLQPELAEEEKKEDNSPRSFERKIDDDLLIDSEFLPDKAYAALGEECLKNTYGSTAYFVAKKIRTTEKTVAKILSKADWATLRYGKYMLSDNQLGESRILDLIKPVSLAFTKPEKLTYFQETISDSGTWRGLYWKFICTIYDDYPEIIKSLAGEILPGDIVPLIKTFKVSQTTVEFAPGLFIELNIPANTIVEYISKILEYCNVDVENVSITYVRKELSIKDNSIQKQKEKTSLLQKEESELIQSETQKESDQSQKTNIKDSKYIVFKEIEEKAEKRIVEDQSLQDSNESNEKKRRHLRRRYYQIQKEEFYLWMQEKKNIDPKEANAYIRILQAAEDYANEFISGNCRLFSADEDTIELTLTALEKDKSFNISIINNRPSMAPAMKLFREYHEIVSLEPSTEPIITEPEQDSNAGDVNSLAENIYEPTLTVQKTVSDVLQEPAAVTAVEQTAPQKPSVELHKELTAGSQGRLDSFRKYLIKKRALAEKTAVDYCTTIQMIEEYIESKDLRCSIYDANAVTIQAIYSMLMSRSDFAEIDKMHRRKYSSVLEKYNVYLRDEASHANVSGFTVNRPSSVNRIQTKKVYTVLKDAIVAALEDSDSPLTAQAILEKIEKEALFHFSTSNKLSSIIYELQRYTEGFGGQFRASPILFLRNVDDEENVTWELVSKKEEAGLAVSSVQEKPKQERIQWKESDICSIMVNHFRYGLNADSPIELHRFRNYYQTEVGKEFPDSDLVLQKTIKKQGFVYEDKAYIVDKTIMGRIRQILKDSDTNGVLFFYELFYEKNEDWLFEGNILSPNMLKAYLMRILPENRYKNNYFTTRIKADTETTIIKVELLRIWGDSIKCRMQELCERLPYIPQEKIRYTLSYSGEFIRTAAETYVRRNSFVISDEQLQDIIDSIREKCDEEGSIAFDDLDIDEVSAENYEFSESAIYSVIASLLPKEFAISGKIISRAEDSTKGETAILNFCKKHESCKLQELLDELERATGSTRIDYVIDVASSVMVRVDEETFVSDGLINFDVKSIDEVLEEMVPEDGIGLKEITSFGLFPYCGYTWNLFLLESYCRRFSEKFRFSCLRANSGNAGAIARKTNKLDYHHLMAASLAKSSVKLDEEQAYNHLIDTGFLLRRRYNGMPDLLLLAKTMREE